MNGWRRALDKQDVVTHLSNPEGFPLAFAGSWTYSRSGYSCSEGCCEEYNLTLDDVIDNIANVIGENWEEVQLHD